jgi:putative mRNA 3-end processing factor
LRKFGDVSLAFASGWMQIRGMRRRRVVDRGFAISDHADWDGLLGAIDATGAEEIIVTHGYRSTLVRWLREHGRITRAIATAFEGEMEGAEVPTENEGLRNVE